MKAHYDHLPENIERIAPGRHHFNYNIEPYTDNEVAEGGYICDQVEIAGEVSYEKVVRAIIRSRYDESEEFSIVNKYNAYIIGTGGEDGYLRYKAFLDEVGEIKRLVKSIMGVHHEEV